MPKREDAKTPKPKKPKGQVQVRRQKTGRLRRPGKDLELRDITLKGRGLDAALTSAIIAADLEQTMDGASNFVIRIRDYRRVLLRSGLVRGRTTITYDGIQYRLCKVEKSGDELGLTFEETAVNVLRGQTGAFKRRRKKVTRAQFIALLADEPKKWEIPFKAPELKEKQPVKSG